MTTEALDGFLFYKRNFFKGSFLIYIYFTTFHF